MTGILAAGMHRSGTSVLAATLAAGGWHPGEELLHPADSRLAEYFEDASLVALHRSWLERATPPGAGHADWGLSDGGPPDPSLVPGLAEQARSFARERDGQRPRWVAKDPRGTWFLHEWAAAVPELRFVLTYRVPWDTLDSVLRVGHGPFCADPDFVRRAWTAYAERTLRFVRAAGDRCLLLAGEAVVSRPAEVHRALDGFVGMDPPREPVVEAGRFLQRGLDHPIAAVDEVLYPDLVELLGELDALAAVGRPDPRPEPARSAAPGGTCGRRAVQVVLSCRDEGAYLDEAVASVDAALAAVGSPAGAAVELTVVDDASHDPETARVLDRLRASGRQVVRRERTDGPAATLVGAAVSRARAIIPLPADHRLEPALLAAAATVVAGGVDVVAGPWIEFGVRNGEVPLPASDGSRPPVTGACVVVRRPRWWRWPRRRRFARLDVATFRHLVRDCEGAGGTAGR